MMLLGWLQGTVFMPKQGVHGVGYAEAVEILADSDARARAQVNTRVGEFKTAAITVSFRNYP